MSHRAHIVSALLGSIAATVALAGGSLVAAQERGVAGDAAAGKQLYYDHGCYGCHGFNGETGARDLVATGSPIIADVATFTTYLRLRADQAPLLPSTRMPNYPESALSDAEVRDIYAYVRTFALNAPEVDEVPALKAILDAASRPSEP
jgi:mono/diheme cytochrome c family protein